MTRAFDHPTEGKVVLISAVKARELEAKGVKQGTQIKINGVLCRWWSEMNPNAPEMPERRKNRSEMRAQAALIRRESRRATRADARREKDRPC